MIFSGTMTTTNPFKLTEEMNAEIANELFDFATNARFNVFE
jgi:hypothetical protein